MTGALPFADLALSRRLERAEALSGRRFVEARARVAPGSGATWQEIAGASVMYDGPASPVTQTFGLGLFQPAGDIALDTIEAFYMDRGAPVYHEVSPLADLELHATLASRGYRPVEFTSVMYRAIDRSGLKARAAGESTVGARAAGLESVANEVVQVPRSAVTVRVVEPGEEEVYAQVSAAGWSESGMTDMILSIGRLSAHIEGARLFVAEIDGTAIAAGALNLCGDVAHLAGASTIPAGRNRGAQLALLDYRLRHAAEHGCDIALMGALPGSGSQRNAERNGFRVAYTRVKWGRT